MEDNQWVSVFALPTPEIIRRQVFVPGEGILWSSRAKTFELSAYGALAWENREGRPPDPRCQWSGANLLCNAAPTPFSLDGERFWSVDSFYEALKLPEGSAERAVCASAAFADAKRLTRRHRSDSFTYRGETIAVGSSEHEALIASAIVAKLAQHSEVRDALRATGFDRLVMPRRMSGLQGLVGRVTPLALMLERWKRFRR